MSHPEERNRVSSIMVNVTLVGNFFLALIKLVFGVLGSSSGLVADGINSSVDVIHTIVLKNYIRISNQPPDLEHPYGHGQLESISAIIVGAFVITTSLVILGNAIEKTIFQIVEKSPTDTLSMYTLYIAVFSVFLKIVLYFFTFKSAKKINHFALLALAKDHRNDAFSALAVIVGILGHRFHFYWADSAAAIFVSIFIFLTGVTILKESSQELMTVKIDTGILEKIENIVLETSSVVNIENMQTHKYGAYFALNIKLRMNKNLTILDCNPIEASLEKKLKDALPFLLNADINFTYTEES